MLCLFNDYFSFLLFIFLTLVFGQVMVILLYVFFFVCNFWFCSWCSFFQFLVLKFIVLVSQFYFSFLIRLFSRSIYFLFLLCVFPYQDTSRLRFFHLVCYKSFLLVLSPSRFTLHCTTINVIITITAAAITPMHAVVTTSANISIHQREIQVFPQLRKS